MGKIYVIFSNMKGDMFALHALKGNNSYKTYNVRIKVRNMQAVYHMS